MGAGFADGVGQALVTLAIVIAACALAIGLGIGWLVFA